MIGFDCCPSESQRPIANIPYHVPTGHWVYAWAPFLLAEMPEIGTIEQQESGIRGFPVTKQVNLFYRISEQNLILLLFFSNRQHPGEKGFDQEEGLSGE